MTAGARLDRHARFDAVSAIADTVLYEGYLLYPYRASAQKNRFRWQFGTLAPRQYAEGRENERWAARTELLIDGGEAAGVTVRVRFLQLQTCQVEGSLTPNDARSAHGNVPADTGGDPWNEGCLREFTEGEFSLAELSTPRSFLRDLPASRDVQAVPANGSAPRTVVRDSARMSFELHVSAETLDNLVKLRIQVANITPWLSSSGDRASVLLQSMMSCHIIAVVRGGAFVSLIDPPAEAAAAASACRQDGLWPVLAGTPPDRDIMIAAPIVLYDYPSVAQESAGDFFDATEIDELLTLRVLTMTDTEKVEAAATDPRTRAILERVERSRPADLARLHGTFRDSKAAGNDDTLWETLLNPPDEPAPENATVLIGSERLGRGSRVRLTPRRGTDSFDMFLAGRTGTIAAVYRDLEDRTFIAVTLDGDPAAELRASVGRHLHFLPDEIESLSGLTEPAAANE